MQVHVERAHGLGVQRGSQPKWQNYCVRLGEQRRQHSAVSRFALTVTCFEFKLILPPKPSHTAQRVGPCVRGVQEYVEGALTLCIQCSHKPGRHVHRVGLLRQHCSVSRSALTAVCFKFNLKLPPKPSHTTSVWDLASGECKSTLSGHTGYVRSVAISPDGQTIVSSSDDNTIR